MWFSLRLLHSNQPHYYHYYPQIELHCRKSACHVIQSQLTQSHPIKKKKQFPHIRHRDSQNFVITNLLQLFKMLPQELHRTLRLSDAEVHNALFEDLLDVVLLHENFTALQTFVFFQSGGGGGHLIFYLCGSGRETGWTMRGGQGSQRRIAGRTM